MLYASVTAYSSETEMPLTIDHPLKQARLSPNANDANSPSLSLFLPLLPSLPQYPYFAFPSPLSPPFPFPAAKRPLNRLAGLGSALAPPAVSPAAIAFWLNLEPRKRI